MIVDVEMPHQGLTLTEAMLLRWLKAPGDTVEKDEGLFEIETEKAVQEMPCPVTGIVLALLVQEGDTVPLGDIVAKIGTDATDQLTDDVPTTTPAPPNASPSADEAMTAPMSLDASSSCEIPAALVTVAAAPVASPRAQRAARQYTVDLASVTASGAEGRHIVERDVLAEVARTTAGIRQTVSSARLITAERTAASFRDTPHFYLTREIVVDRLLTFRQTLLEDLGEQVPARVSLTDCLLKALALALVTHPTLNRQWHDGEMTALTSCEIGLATDTPHGLLVPVLREVASASLLGIAAQRQTLLQRAQAGQLTSGEMTGGSMTLSNLGALDIDLFHAIINPPQSAILAVGVVKPRPVVVEGELRVANTVFLTLAVDHRVADGADGARFLQSVIALLTHPLRLCCSTSSHESN